MGKLLNLPPLIRPKAADVEYYCPELKELDLILQELPNLEPLLIQVEKDVYPGSSGRGKHGMPAIQIIKCGLLKKIRQMDYREFEEACKDSVSVIKFLDLTYGEVFSRTKLNNVIRRVKASTWEAINKSMIELALKKKLETGEKIRTDCFSIKTNIHYPTDWSLMNDSIRVICSTTTRIKEILEKQLKQQIVDRRRTAKTMLFQINNLRQLKVKRKYKLKLIRTINSLLLSTEKLIKYLEGNTFVFKTVLQGTYYEALLFKLKEHYKLGVKVHNQSYRRILKKEEVPAQEKLVSIFETHTDIISKGKREVVFGHKVCVSTSQIGMIVNIETLSGNPNDSSLLKDQMKNSKDNLNTKIKTVVTDGCFGSKSNLDYAIELGVEEMTCIKKTELDYGKCKLDKKFKRKLRNFRAGVEADISNLIRGYGLKRILEKGKDGFHSSVQLSALSYNCVLLVRAIIKRRKKQELAILKKAA